MDDAQIVEMYMQRDEQAITQTDQKYGRALKAMSMRILMDESDSNECVNDTYFRAWNSIPPTQPKSLSAYLYRIVRSISIDRFRARMSQKRRMGEYTASLDELSECIAGEGTPQGTLETQMLTATIQIFLEKIPKQQRQIFLCRYYFLDPIQKIAGYFQMSESRVKSILYRLRCRLKKVLEQEGFFL